MIDSQVSLAFALHSNPGTYAALVGSGVSGQVNALALLIGVSVSFVLLVAYEAVAEGESRRHIRSHEEDS